MTGTRSALFNRKGYLQTTLDDIASAARFSKGGIYHYFENKEEILFSILTIILAAPPLLQDLKTSGLDQQVNAAP